MGTINDREWLGIGLIAVGAGLAVNSLVGPLITGRMVYPVTNTMLNQTLALDGFSLVVVVPLSLVVGILALRGHPAAPVLVLGPALYTVYMLVQYVVGPDYLQFPIVLTLHLIVFVLAWAVGLMAWNRIRPEDLRPDGRRRDRILGTILLILAGFVLLRYLPALAGSFSGAPLPAEAQGDPAMFWTILLLDLGIVVPVSAGAGINLLASGSDWARKAGYATVGWFALVGSSVAAMGIVMMARDDEYASIEMVAGFALTALAAIAATIWLYRPLLVRDLPDPSESFR